MSDKKLFTYYSTQECSNVEKVYKKLISLQDDDKIFLKIHNDELFQIEDIELSDKELDNLLDLFDKNDIIPDLDKSEEDLDSSEYFDFDEDGGEDWSEDY
jgi:hypothetical protein